MKNISIIIPMYNVEEHLEQCVLSVFNQQVPESDFEIVMVDDGSPDNSFVVATHLTFNNTNVKIIRQENKGLGGARNSGILHATGKYLLFLDADDHLLPDVLSRLSNAAAEEDLDILEFGARGISASNKILYEIKNKSQIFFSGFDYYNSIRYMHSACNKLYKRDFLIDNNIFFLEQIFIEDFEFNTRCLAGATKLKAIDLVVSQFLQSDNSITRNNDEVKKQKMTTDIMTVLKITDIAFRKQARNHTQTTFYLERLNFLVATLFYQLLKRNAGYNEVLALKTELVANNLFYVNHKIFDTKKNIFRILFLRNLWTYKIYNFLKLK